MAYLPEELRLQQPTLSASSGQVWVLDGEDGFVAVAAAGYIDDARSRGVRLGDTLRYRIYDDISTRDTVLGMKEFIVSDVTDGAATLEAVYAKSEAKGAIIDIVNAAADTLGIVITLTNEEGAVIEATQAFEVYISESADGMGLTTASASGGIAIENGSELFEFTAKKHLSVTTDALGAFAMTLEDSGEAEDQYVVVKLPNGRLVVSEPTVAAMYNPPSP